MNLDRNVLLNHLRVLPVKIGVYSAIIFAMVVFGVSYETLTILGLILFVSGEAIFMDSGRWEATQSRIMVFLKENITEILVLIGVVTWFFVFANTPKSINDLTLRILESYLALLIGVLALGVPFFLDIISRISKEWHGNIARAYAFNTTNKFFVVYLILSVLLAFSLLFILQKAVLTEEVKTEFLPFDYSVIAQVFTFTVALFAFIVKSFRDYSAPEQNVIAYFTKALKKQLSLRFYPRPHIPSDLNRMDILTEGIPKRVKIRNWLFAPVNIIHSWFYFLDGRQRDYKAQYLFFEGERRFNILDQDFEDILPQLKILYRVANAKLASEQFDSLDGVFSALYEINRFYIQKRGFVWSSSDKYISEVMYPETKLLFKKALNLNYEDGIEVIVHFVGETSLLLLENVSDEEFHINSAQVTSLLEDLLEDFATQSFAKENTPATGMSIAYLKKIASVYVEKEEFIKATFVLEHLKSLATYFAAIPAIIKESGVLKPHMIGWAQSKCLQSVQSMLEIVLESLKTSDQRHWGQFFDDAKRGSQEALISLHKSSISAKKSLDSQLYKNIFDVVSRIIAQTGIESTLTNEQKEAIQYKHRDLFWLLLNVAGEANSVGEDDKEALKKEQVGATMHLFALVHGTYHKTENESLKRQLRKTLVDFSFLFDVRYRYLERTFFPVNCIDEFSVIIAIAVKDYYSDENHKALLERSIDRVIHYFESLNEQNDEHCHRRRHLYKRLLMYGFWLDVYLRSNNPLYKRLKQFLKENSEFVERGSFNHSFYPERSRDFYSRGNQLWRLSDQSGYFNWFDATYETLFKEFDERTPESLIWKFLEKIEQDAN